MTNIASSATQGLSTRQLIGLMKEINLSGFLNPIVDEVSVRLITSKSRFSKLITRYPRIRSPGAPREYEIQLNSPATLMMSNLFSVLMGDHDDAAVYFDTAFSVTYYNFASRKNLKFTDCFNYLERERPSSFEKIRQFSKMYAEQTFAAAMSSARSKFYSGFEGLDPHGFAVEAVTRFVLGHEIGHILKDKYPDFCDEIQKQIGPVEGYDIAEDEELFCDCVAMLHVLKVKNALGGNLRPIIVIMCSIITFFDLMAVADEGKRGVNPFAGPRFQILLKIANSCNNDLMVTDVMELVGDMERILWPAMSVIKEVFELLGDAANENSMVPDWYLKSSDFFYLPQGEIG